MNALPPEAQDRQAAPRWRGGQPLALRLNDQLGGIALHGDTIAKPLLQFLGEAARQFWGEAGLSNHSEACLGIRWPVPGNVREGRERDTGQAPVLGLMRCYFKQTDVDPKN